MSRGLAARLERGFRRITVTTSVLALLAGLGLSPIIVPDWRERGRRAEVLDRAREIRDDTISLAFKRTEKLARLRNDVLYRVRRTEELTPSEAAAFDLDRGAITFEDLSDAGQALVREEWPFLVPPPSGRAKDAALHDAASRLATRDALLYQLGTGAVGFADLSTEQRRLIGLERPRWEVAELWSLRLALAVALSLLPWVLFYVVRWIAKGFMAT